MGENYFWNGQPCMVDFVLYRPIITPETPKKAWYRVHEGQHRQGIIIKSWGEPFLIDNERGQGYQKITAGAGMWTSGHKSCDSYKIERRIDPDEVKKVFDKPGHEFDCRKEDSLFTTEEIEHRNALLDVINNNAFGAVFKPTKLETEERFKLGGEFDFEPRD